MAGPIGGVGAGIAQEVLKHAQQVQPKVGGQQEFAQVLKQTQEAHEVGGPKAIDPHHLQVHQPQKVESAVPGTLQKMLKGFVARTNDLDNLMKVAMSGKNFSMNELMALQAFAHKTTFALEGTAKLVEATSNALKTTLQTQV